MIDLLAIAFLLAEYHLNLGKPGSFLWQVLAVPAAENVTTPPERSAIVRGVGISMAGSSNPQQCNLTSEPS
jgi:hypothetical protein